MERSGNPGQRAAGASLGIIITASLAGLLFGFDTVVISGAEQKIHTLWDLSAGTHGMATASALRRAPSFSFSAA